MSPVLLIFLLLIIIFFILSLTRIFFCLIIGPERKKGSLQWLNGSLYWDWPAKRIGFDLFNHRIWRGSLEKKKETKRKRKKRKKKKKFNYIALWQEKGTLLKTIKIIFSSSLALLKRVRLEKFWLDAKIATPDPALTGMLYGGISTISYPLSTFLPPNSIRIYPDFETESPGGNMEIIGKIRLFNLFWFLVRTFFLLPKTALIKTIRRINQRRR